VDAKNRWASLFGHKPSNPETVGQPAVDLIAPRIDAFGDTRFENGPGLLDGFRFV
jgi:hypothetical protein